MKSMFYLIFLFNFVTSEVPVWSGRNVEIEHNFEVMKLNTMDKIKIAMLDNIRKFHINESKILDHVILRDIIIFPIDVSESKPLNKGISFKNNLSQFRSTFADNKNKRTKLVGDETANCYIYTCNIGFFFYHQVVNGQEIIKRKTVDFDNVIYIKLTTKKNEFLIGNLKYVSKMYPLIICPYDNWVGTISGAQFVTFDISGIQYDKLSNRHIIQSMYPRNSDKSKFICGELKYIDGTSLKIGYEIELDTSEVSLTAGKINISKDSFVCGPETNESSYYHFSYNNINKNNIEMRFLNLEKSKNISIFHNDIIYMYDKFGPMIERLKNEGFSPNSYNGNISPTIKPLCFKKVGNFHGTLKLFYVDGTEVNLEGDKNKGGKKSLTITEKTVDKKIILICEIIVQSKESKYNVKDFFKKSFKGSLVAVGSKNKDKEVKELVFTRDSNNYGTYKCILKPANGDHLHEDHKLIEELTFEIIKSKELEITNVYIPLLIGGSIGILLIILIAFLGIAFMLKKRRSKKGNKKKNPKNLSTSGSSSTSTSMSSSGLTSASSSSASSASNMSKTTGNKGKLNGKKAIGGGKKDKLPPKKVAQIKKKK
uniref:Bee-milk protein n=1 Tax=Parastrongyloides trichosuri TaxID=131310 RepID=A0A0N4Z6U8_PARTI